MFQRRYSIKPDTGLTIRFKDTDGLSKKFPHTGSEVSFKTLWSTQCYDKRHLFKMLNNQIELNHIK